MKNLYKKLQSKLLKKFENMKNLYRMSRLTEVVLSGIVVHYSFWIPCEESLHLAFILGQGTFKWKQSEIVGLDNSQQSTPNFLFDTCKNQTPYWYIELMYTFTLRELKTGLAHTDSCNVHSLIHFRSNKVKEVLPVGTDWEIGVRKYLDTSESCMDSQNLTCSPSIKLWGEKLYRVTKVVLWNTELSTTTNLLHSSWLSQQPHPSLHNVKS